MSELFVTDTYGAERQESDRHSGDGPLCSFCMRGGPPENLQKKHQNELRPSEINKLIQEKMLSGPWCSASYAIIYYRG